MPLALIGLALMSAMIGYGAWTIFNSMSFKKTTNRYRYVKTKDEYGNEITKVVDLEDDEDART